MFCNNCGHSLPDDAVSCNNCGENVQSMAENILKNYDRNIKKHGATKKKLHKDNITDNLDFKKIFSTKRIVIYIGILIILVAGFFTWQALQPDKTPEKFIAALNSNKYEEAYKMYDDTLKSGNDMTEFNNKVKPFLNEKIDKYIYDFNNNLITVKEVNLAFSYFKDYNIVKDELAGADIEIKQLTISKKKFEIAKDYLNNKNYINAIKNLEDVIEKDINYKIAQSYINESVPLLKTFVLQEAEKLVTTSEFNYAVAMLDEVNTILKDEDITSKVEYYKKMQAKFIEGLDAKQRIIAKDEDVIKKLYDRFPWLKIEDVKIESEN